jgi:hypothetical protein
MNSEKDDHFEKLRSERNLGSMSVSATRWLCPYSSRAEDVKDLEASDGGRRRMVREWRGRGRRKLLRRVEAAN